MNDYPGAAGNGDGGDGPAAEPGLSPESVLESLGAQTNEAAIFPGSLREQYLFAYDMLLDQELAGRFLKGQLGARVVQLAHHKLVWPYYFPPAASALPSLERTNRPEDSVWGVIYGTRGRDLTALERYLRTPNRYHRHAVSVQDRGGRRFAAFCYVLTLTDALPSKPATGLLQGLVAAAAERGLPEEWVAQLRQLETAAEHLSGGSQL